MVGYGCTTCIGNSGPLPEPVAEAVHENDLVVAAVLSGNRNFEGRIHPQVRANYLASPPLVVAYALAGTVDIDLTSEPLGHGSERRAGLPARHLADAAPKSREAMRGGGRAGACSASSTPTSSTATSAGRRCRCPSGDLYEWDPQSTYIQEPPFFEDLDAGAGAAQRHRGRARAGRCSATRSPPTTSRPPARSRRTAPPAST